MQQRAGREPYTNQESSLSSSGLAEGGVRCRIDLIKERHEFLSLILGLCMAPVDSSTNSRKKLTWHHVEYILELLHYYSYTEE